MPGPHRRLYLSATRKSSGKTCIAAGMLRALRRRGLAVAPFKKGPDYIDPMWLARAAGRPCRNLDFHTQTPAEIGATAARAGGGCALIEGNKGLFDGVAEDGSDSNAALAKLLDAPVLLALDCAGTTRGVAPLVQGYRRFDAAVRYAGAILNRTGGSRHEAKLARALEQHTDLPVLGALGRAPELELEERHLGLVTCAEQADAEERLERMARAVEQGVDLDRLLDRDAPAPPETPAAIEGPWPELRIGYARDAAFGFYYPDDLERFAECGARLLPFDTLTDAAPPEMDGLWLGGGFPETQAAALAANTSMRAALRRLLADGLPAYAECGGLMYLSRRLRFRGMDWDMVGAVAADCTVGERPQGRGLAELEATADFPWPGVAPGAAAPAHEFHYSRLENLPDGARWGWRVRRGDGIAPGADGLVQGNLFAAYCHLRHTQRFEWVQHFTEFVRGRQ